MKIKIKWHTKVGMYNRAGYVKNIINNKKFVENVHVYICINKVYIVFPKVRRKHEKKVNRV